MNRTETIDWIACHGEAFPDFGAWVNGIKPAKTRSKLIDAWSEALEDVELRDAKAVTRRMLAGDDPAIAAYEREQTPAKVRILAKSNRDRRCERDRLAKQRQSQEPTAPSGSGISAGQLYRQLLELLDAKPELTAREAAEQIMPPASDDGPRFHCPLCLDSGLVTVWSSMSVRAALAGQLDDQSKRRTCVAPCKCPAGTAKVWGGNGDPPAAWRGWRTLEAVYSPLVHCICRGGDTDSPEAIDQFREWVILSLDAHRNRNRQREFDDWNAGATV